jgi:hypothetical protein
MYLEKPSHNVVKFGTGGTYLQLAGHLIVFFVLFFFAPAFCKCACLSYGLSQSIMQVQLIFSPLQDIKKKVQFHSSLVQKLALEKEMEVSN